MNHEWLSHAIFYAMYWIGGMPMLTAMAATACTASVAVIVSLMKGPMMLRLGIVAVTLLTFARGWAPRPYIFTSLLLALTVKLLLSKRSWWLPVVFVLWANLHGGFTMGITVVCASVIAALPDGRGAVLRRLGLVAACLVASLITPLGITFYEELPGSLARLKGYNILEWRSPDIDNPSLAAFWLCVPVLLVGTFRRWREVLADRDDRLFVVAAFVFLPFALMYIRSVGPFMVMALPAVTRVFPVAPTGWVTPVPALARAHVAVLCVALLAAVSVVGTAWATPWKRLRWDPMQPEAIAAIDACEGRIFTSYNDGGYLIWFMPHRPVFVNSRQDPYPVDLIMSDINARWKGEYVETFERHQIRCALVRNDERHGSLGETLEDDGWLKRYEDDNWLLFEADDGLASMAANR